MLAEDSMFHIQPKLLDVRFQCDILVYSPLDSNESPLSSTKELNFLQYKSLI